MHENPFIAGNPVPRERLVGRERAVNTILSRLRTEGQSSLIVGEARMGKSSLLRYLSHPSTLEPVAQSISGTLLISEVDAQALPRSCSRAGFWARALKPLRQRVQQGALSPVVERALERCAEEDFAAEALEELIPALLQADLRIVIFIDELEELLSRPGLATQDFFGGLRSLSYLSRGALALVMASRLSRAELDAHTAHLCAGSPFFNHLKEVHVGPLNRSAGHKILAWAGLRFAETHQSWLLEAAGGHPYLLQAAASALWELNDASQQSWELLEELREHVLEEARALFLESWRSWSEEQRAAIANVALLEAVELARGELPSPRSDHWRPPQPMLKTLQRLGPAYTPAASTLLDALGRRGILELAPALESQSQDFTQPTPGPLPSPQAPTVQASAHRMRSPALWTAALELIERTPHLVTAPGGMRLPALSSAFSVMIVGAVLDRPLYERLIVALSPVRRQHGLRIRSSYDVELGQNRRESLESGIDGARFVLLLLTPDLLHCDEAYALTRRACERARLGGAQVIPLRLRAHDPDEVLKGLEALPRGGPCLASAPDPDTAWAGLVEELRRHWRV